MLVFSGVMFTVSLLLLTLTAVRLIAARRAGRTQERTMLRWSVAGLGLTACSYLSRIHDLSRGAHPSYGGFLCCLAGTGTLGVAYGEWVKRRGTRLPGRPLPGLPFSLSAHRALLQAHDEAQRQGRLLVDADHLLLGLLEQPQCGGTHLLWRLGVPLVNVRTELRERRSHGGPPRCGPNPGEGPSAAVLTDRARQAIDSAAQEARRFDSACIGTEHLLLGLVLKGMGPAAHALSARGVTPDRVRQAILQDQRVTR